uniref:N-terminal Ras-GEF domain-containing protein n=1 Tax=Plectus sambesii TaxID=2011161 RepID=A0A914UWZ4_9BILA
MQSLQQRLLGPPMISVSDATPVDNDISSPCTPTAARELDGGDLRFAPVHRLVEMCVLSFEVDGELRESQAHFPMALFLVHQWWMPFSELGAHFVAQYKSAPKRCELCARGDNEHKSDIERCESTRYRTLLCHAVARWIRAFPMHFDANSQLCKLVERLQTAALQDGFPHLADLLDVSAV